MKRCVQWFSLLWVSATLAWSQTPVVSPVTTNRPDLRWDDEKVQAPGLLSDFTLTDIPKAGDATGEPKSPAVPLLPACAITRHAPVLLCCGHIVFEQTDGGEPAAIRLPLNCGPPAQA